MQAADKIYRHNTYHRTKKQIVGRPLQPAWRPNVAQAKRPPADIPGSKIFLSQLPIDVNEQEVEELFRKTVGPVKEAFLVYNSQGKSKGMAVVSFMRPSDATLARNKYNGKIVDGRRPIKIEIVTDGMALPSPSHPAGPPGAPSTAPSLMDRLGLKATPATQAGGGPSLVQRTQTVRKHPMPNQPLVAKLQAQAAAAIAAGGPVPVAGVPSAAPIPPHRLRVRKGPKRLKKRPVTAEDLDKEMDEYRASFPETDFIMS